MLCKFFNGAAKLQPNRGPLRPKSAATWWTCNDRFGSPEKKKENTHWLYTRDNNNNKFIIAAITQVAASHAFKLLIDFRKRLYKAQSLQIALQLNSSINIEHQTSNINEMFHWHAANYRLRKTFRVSWEKISFFNIQKNSESYPTSKYMHVFFISCASFMIDHGIRLVAPRSQSMKINHEICVICCVFVFVCDNRPLQVVDEFWIDANWNLVWHLRKIYSSDWIQFSSFSTATLETWLCVVEFVASSWFVQWFKNLLQTLQCCVISACAKKEFFFHLRSNLQAIFSRPKNCHCGSRLVGLRNQLKPMHDDDDDVVPKQSSKNLSAKQVTARFVEQTNKQTNG